MSLTSDIVDLANDFEKMFFEDPYDNTWTFLKSSKNKDSMWVVIFILQMP